MWILEYDFPSTHWRRKAPLLWYYLAVRPESTWRHSLGKWQKRVWRTHGHKKKNPLQVLMGFRIASTGVREAWVLNFSTTRTKMCLRVAPSQLYLPKAELCLFPRSLTSTTMEGSWDHRKHCVRWRHAIAIARFSPQRFVEAFIGTAWDVYIHLIDVSHPGQWRITFSRSRLLPQHMLRALHENLASYWRIWCRLSHRQSLLDLPRSGQTELPEFICRFLRNIYYNRRGTCRNDPRTILHGQGREARLPLGVHRYTSHVIFSPAQCTRLMMYNHTSWLKTSQGSSVCVHASRHLHAIHDERLSVCCVCSSFWLSLCVSPSPCSSLPTSTCTLTWTPSMWTTPRQLFPVPPATEESCPLAEFTPHTGYESKLLDDFHFSETTEMIFQEKSGDKETEPSCLCEAELHDETTGKALSSPLFIEERRESADRRQACHSNEESLLPAQSFFAHSRTGRPVHELSSLSSCREKPSREMENETIRILLERQKEQIFADFGAEIQKHESQRREIDRNLAGDEQLRRVQLLLMNNYQNKIGIFVKLMWSLNEMEELKRFQGSTFDTIARR